MYNQYYIYILSNNTNSTLYIGVTNELERRVAEHKSGAIPREKQLKKWSRIKKDRLINTMNKERLDLMPLCYLDQLSFHTERVISELRFVGSYEV